LAITAERLEIKIDADTKGAERKINKVGRAATETAAKVGVLSASLSTLVSAGKRAAVLSAVVGVVGALGAGLYTLAAAAAAAATPLAGLGLAAGGLGAAFAGGILAAKNSEDRLKALKKSAQEAIRPLRAFSELSFGALETGVSFLGDLASMLASLKPQITGVASAWGDAFSGQRGAILRELKATIAAFLPAIKDLGLAIINGAAPALKFLRQEGQKALPFLTQLASATAPAIASFIRFGNQALPAVSSAIATVIGWLKSVVAQVSAFYAGMDGTGALVVFRNAVSAIGDALRRLSPGLKGATKAGRVFGRAVVKAANVVRTAQAKYQQFAATVKGYTPRVTNAVATLRTGFNDLKRSVAALGPGPVRFSNALATVRTALGEVWKAVKPLATALKAQLKVAFGAIKQAVANLRPTLTKLLELWRKNRSTIVPFVKAVIGLVGPIGKLAAAIGTVLAPVLVGFAQGVWTVIRPLVNTLTPAIKALGPIITKVATKIQTWATRNQELLRKLGKVAGVVAGLFAPFGTLFGRVGRLIGVVGRFFPRLAKLISFFGRVGASATRLVSRFVKFGSRVTKTIAQTFSRVTKTVASAMGRAGAKIRGGWNAARQIVSSALSTILRTVRTTLGDVVGAFRTGMGNAKRAVKTGIDSAVSTVTDAGSRFLNAGKGLMQSFSTSQSSPADCFENLSSVAKSVPSNG